MKNQTTPPIKHRWMNFVLIVTIFLLNFIFEAQAQDLRHSRRDGYYTYIYKITDKEAKKVYRKDLYKINETFFHSLIDSFPTDSTYRKLLASGYYVFVNAEANQLKFKLVSGNNVEVKIINNSSDLVIYATDKLGNVINDATIKINNRSVKFDTLTKTYRLKHNNARGFLSVNYKGVYSYYSINRQKNNSAFKRTSRKIFYQTPVKYVAIPIVFTATLPWDIYRLAFKQQRRGWIYTLSEPVYDIVQSLSWGEPQGFIKKISQKFEIKTKTDGYVAFNKTIYRLGDTVKWKAYILDSKKKPFNKEFDLKLLNTINSKNINLGKAKPIKAGVYYGNFVLADSMNLILDNNYVLILSFKKYSISNRFKLEDYELKSTKYELHAAKKVHYCGEENSLILKGTDENKLSLPDITAEIILRTQSIEKGFGNRTFIPDTLWHTKVDLEASGETVVKLPREIFPTSNFSYLVTVNFLNTSNERGYKELELKYFYKEDVADIFLKNDSVVFSRRVNGVSVPSKGKISFTKSNDVISEFDVDLPYSCKLSAFISRYTLQIDDGYIIKSLGNEQSLVYSYTDRDADSIRFSIDNPRNLPLTCYVYNLNKEVYRTNNVSSFTISGKSVNNYYLSLNYIWNNQVVTENYEIPLKTEELNITSDQPEYIYPGKKVSIKLKVTDYRSKPVEGADILAYGLTSKMPGIAIPNIPDFEVKRKQKELINTFFLKQDELNYGTGMLSLNWNKWNPRMHLDSISYFQFFYPKQGMFSQCFAVDSSTYAYISPYVVQNGRILPVYSISINNQPVYSHYTNVDIPYVFPVPSGRLHLKIRVPGAEITASDLYVEMGNKYIMSFTNDTSNRFATIIEKPYKLNTWEENNIKSTLMVINKPYNKEDYSYITQNNQIYRLVPKNYSQELVVGPLIRSAYRYEVPGEYSLIEDFESGYIYKFKKGVVKMYSPSNKFVYYKPYAESISQNFSETVLKEKEILTEWKTNQALKQATSYHYNNPFSTQKGFGKMILNAARLPKGFVKNLILFQYGSPDFIRVYGGSTSIIHQLPKGIYRAVLIAHDNSYLEADSLQISANGNNLFNVSSNWQSSDSVSNEIDKIIHNEFNKTYTTAYQERKTFQEITETYAKDNNITSYNDNIIEGYILDSETNEPIPGVNIIIEGTTIGVVSDLNGFYKIGAPKNSGALVFSFIGYLTERVPIGFSGKINVSLSADVQRLEEVVVIGYGVMKKSDVTGSVITIRSQKSLQGKASGINTSNNSDLYNSNEFISKRASTSKGILSDKTLADDDFLNSLAYASTLRTKFADNAFWQPALTTDKNGEATFEVSFPDDITEWKTYYLAMGNRKSGIMESKIQAFKPMTANLAIPRFLTHGDTCIIIGRATNYGKDTVQVSSVFKINGLPKKEDTFNLVNFHIDSLSITASDSLKVTYQLKPNKGFADGEEKTIPVFPQGSLETEGFFKTLSNDSSCYLRIPSQYKKGELYLESHLIEVMRSEALHVYNYSYLCNEQAASKLKCLLAEKIICRYLKEDFKYDRDIKKLINRLEESKNRIGLWGWWRNSPQQMWISLHVVEALIQAQKEGYKIQLITEELKSHLISIYPTYADADKIRILKILYQLDAKIRFDEDINALFKNKKLSYPAKLEAIELLQKTGEEVLLDSLISQKRETMYGNYYWRADSLSIERNYILTTLSMYRIIRNDSNYRDYLPKIRNFLLEERKTGNWRNTYESSQIIESILPDMIHGKVQLQKPAIELSINNNKRVIEEFPFKQNIQGGDSILINKKGDFPVYLSVYNRWWNPDPKPISNGFSIQTNFEGGSDILKSGVPVKLLININVMKEASYVMIEIPIPAGCSYDEKRSGFYGEIHREYFKNKVCIFYDWLPKGSFTAEVLLLPRYSGKYILNPAKAEMMYFPVFSGRNEIKNIEIK